MTTQTSEAARLAAVEALGWPDRNGDACLNDIATLAAAFFGAPMAIVSLTGAEHQSAIAAHGVGRVAAPREQSLCRFVVGAGEMIVFENALADPRAATNPFVSGPPGVRFYAGAPLRSEQGLVLGTLCVIDMKPREFDQAQRQNLARFVNMAEQRLRSRVVERSVARAAEARAAAETRTQTVLREATGAFAACDRLALNLEGRVRASIMRIERALENKSGQALGELGALRGLIEELAVTARHDRIAGKGLEVFEPSALVRAIAADLTDYAALRGVRYEVIDATLGASMLGDTWRLEELIEGVLGDCALLSQGVVRVESRFEPVGNGSTCFTLRLSADQGGSWRFSPRNRELVDTLAGCWELSRHERRIAVLVPARLKSVSQISTPAGAGDNIVKFDASRKGRG